MVSVWEPIFVKFFNALICCSVRTRGGVEYFFDKFIVGESQAQQCFIADFIEEVGKWGHIGCIVYDFVGNHLDFTRWTGSEFFVVRGFTKTFPFKEIKSIKLVF